VTTPARPARPPSRWDDRTCGAAGCTCHHDPDREWDHTDPDDQPCDRGQRPAGPFQTTPGVHGPGYHQRGSTPSEDGVTPCPTCQTARTRAREASQ